MTAPTCTGIFVLSTLIFHHAHHARVIYIAKQDGQQQQLHNTKVSLGQQLKEMLESGQAAPDDIVVQLIVVGMQEALYWVPPPTMPSSEAAGATDSSKGKATAAKGGKAAQPAAAAAAAGGKGVPPGGQAAASAAAGRGVSAGKAGAAATPGSKASSCQGFVLDGFPVTQVQSALLEKALTGLDLESEQQLVQGASVVVPPPLEQLPLLERPLVSGLDAVVVLECGGEEEEEVAVQRSLGRRLDPQTGGSLA